MKNNLDTLLAQVKPYATGRKLTIFIEEGFEPTLGISSRGGYIGRVIDTDSGYYFYLPERGFWYLGNRGGVIGLIDFLAHEYSKILLQGGGIDREEAMYQKGSIAIWNMQNFIKLEGNEWRLNLLRTLETIRV